MNQPQTPDTTPTPRTDEARQKAFSNQNADQNADYLGYVYMANHAEKLECDLAEKTNEVARLRELLKLSIQVAQDSIWLADLDYENDAFGKVSSLKWDIANIEKELAALAPAPEEPVIQENRITEPATEWRELGEDEVICEGDEVQPRHHFRDGEWCKSFSYEIGEKAGHFKAMRYRTRRPLPVQQEMPIEDEPIEPILDEEIALIEKWGCSQDPFRSVHAQEAFVHVIHALRCLENEIQQHEDMFTTWIKATEDQRREIRYLRDEIHKLKSTVNKTTPNS